MFVSLLDGTKTIEEVYQLVLSRLGEDAPSELEVLQLLWRLHAADLLKGDVAGRTDDIVARAEFMDRQRWIMQLRSPLAVRIALLDPSRLLDAMAVLARAIFSVPAFIIWLLVIFAGLSQVALNWSELTNNFSDRILSYDNLLLVWFVFPIVKIFHEFGHGLALQRWQCRSHEMGIMFLVFMPVPYIDASSSAILSRPSQRAMVGAAGLYVELFIASLAALLWAYLEPGMVRAVCFNVMLIAGASAVLFNGNPLLKFDAYYILSDVLEIPNLGQRSSQWWLYHIQRSILGIKSAQNPIEAEGERFWFFLYAPLSLTYRLFLMSAISIFVAKKAFFLGTALAVLAIFNTILMPLWRGVRFLFVSPKLRNRRFKALVSTSAVLGGLFAILFFVPVPHRTIAQGVVWYSDGAELRPVSGGVVAHFDAQSGEIIGAGELIAQLSDPETEAEIYSLSARLAALEAQYRRELVTDRQQARLTSEEVFYIRERLDVAEKRVAGLMFESPVTGRLVIPRQRDLDQGWIGRGMPIGHVVGSERMIVIAAIPQTEMEFVTDPLDTVSVRFASNISAVFSGVVTRISPQATDELPSALLSTEGGGPFSIRPNARQELGLRSIDRIFILEVSLESSVSPIFGERAYILLDHGLAPLSVQIRSKLRQLFLREFEV
jgi:putative peptide zinc metalloprotease protein